MSGVGKHVNKAGEYARKMLKSEIAMADAQLWRDYELMLEGQAVYLKGFLCAAEDFTLLKALTNELNDNAGKGMVNWSRHFKHENPDFSATFQNIVDQMADHFDVEVYATRLNFYPDASSWKPFHHDSHAYGGRGLREDFTMGASFGDTRALVFKHVQSDQQFSFPQKNGDIFAFTSTVNQRFQHGVPKMRGSSRAVAGPRFSIIAWGRRRSLNEYNSGKDEVRLEAKARPVTAVEEDREGSVPQELVVEGQEEDDSGPDLDIQDASSMVWDFLTSMEEKKAKRNLRASTDSDSPSRAKVQGGWAGKKGRRGGSNHSDRRVAESNTRNKGSGGGGGGRRGGRGGRRQASEKKAPKDPNQKTASSNDDVQFGW